MATTTGFKQLCPSCEAMVPIRDPKLIGKKVDCPKCKYRFVVEDPSGGDEDDAPKKGKAGAVKAPAKGSPKGPANVTSKKPTNGKASAKTKPGPRRGDDDDEPSPKKKKGGNSTMLILGLGLGAVGIVLLIVVLVLLSSGDGGGGSAGGGGGGGGGGGQQNNSGGGPALPGGGDPNAGNEPPRTSASSGNIANLLPNDADAVVAVSFPELSRSSLQGMVFKAGSTFDEAAFLSRWGFGVNSMSRHIQATNSAEGWFFSIVRLSRSLRIADLVAKLDLEKNKDLSSEKDKLDVYDIRAELDPLGSYLFQSPKQPQPLNLLLLDDQTLVVAHAAPMQKFVADKGKPKVISQAAPTAPNEGGGDQPGGPRGYQPPGGLQPMNPGTGGGGPMPPGPMQPGTGGGGPMPPGPMGPMGPMGPGSGGGGPTPPGGGGENPGGTPSTQQPPAAGSWMSVKQSLKTMLDRLEESGKGTPILTAAVEGTAAQNLPARVSQLAGVELPPQVGRYTESVTLFGLVLFTFKKEMKNAKIVGAVGFEFADEATARQTDERVRNDLRTAVEAWNVALQPAGMRVVVGDQNPQNPGGGFPGGGFPEGGIGPMGPMGPGSVGPRPPMGPMGPTGPFGPMGPMGPFGPMGPGGGTTQPGGTNPDLASTTVNIQLRQKSLILPVEANIPNTIFDMGVLMVGGGLSKLKGTAQMAGNRPRHHDLARALLMYSKAKDQFPRGTADRETSADRNHLPWPPEQRVSWMVEVLPFLGQGEFNTLHLQIDPQGHSWREDANLTAAQTLIPYFLCNSYDEKYRWTKYPGLDKVDVANTHFVGVAGVGLDAARYQEGDVGVAKKIGVFGYDRVTKLGQITDKPENTIVVIQVPPTFRRPWLAGGGATIMGVPETNSVRPFLTEVVHDGKKQVGTFAIMGDGKVRFISDKVTDDQFKAMCTIAGGEDIDVNAIAPEVKPPQSELSTKPVPVPVKPPVDPVKPPVDPEKPVESPPLVPPGAPLPPPPGGDAGKPTTLPFVPPTPPGPNPPR